MFDRKNRLSAKNITALFMSKNVLIVDSGLKNLGGHNFSYTRAVQSALARKGFAVTVFANRNLSGELVKNTGYHPVFSFGAYDYPPGVGKLRDLQYLYAQSVIYSHELEQAFKHLVKDEPALIFCHTVNDFELIGWKRFLSRHHLSGKLVVLMRYTPRFHSCSWLKTKLHPYWRIRPHYLNSLHSRMKGKFVLVTDSEPLTEDYATIFPHQMITLPIPINEYILSAEEQDFAAAGVCARYGLGQVDRIRLGYVGDARDAKGFPLLPGLVRRILSDTNLNVEFVIQCPGAASGVENGQLPEGVEELLALAKQAENRITLIQEKLSESDYAELIRALDIVLVPYRLTGYVEPTSGIFAEAVALAKPVVVPAGTWMARELQKSGGGVEFQSGDEADLAEKVKTLVQNFAVYADKARHFSSQWKTFHNSHSLAEMLIQQIWQEKNMAETGVQRNPVSQQEIIESNE